MLNTSVKRILALVLCLALTISCGSMARAARETSSPDQTQELTEEEVRKHAVSDDQSVYVLTDAAGSVNKIIVSDKLKDAAGNEALSQETVEAALPVDVKISYRLDGQEISPEELAGKSGKAVIRIDYTNNQSETEMVNGASQKLYVPFLMVSALLLDGEHFKNVTVENGRLVNDGTRSAMPSRVWRRIWPWTTLWMSPSRTTWRLPRMSPISSWAPSIPSQPTICSRNTTRRTRTP